MLYCFNCTHFSRLLSAQNAINDFITPFTTCMGSFHLLPGSPQLFFTWLLPIPQAGASLDREQLIAEEAEHQERNSLSLPHSSVIKLNAKMLYLSVGLWRQRTGPSPTWLEGSRQTDTLTPLPPPRSHQFTVRE